MRPRCRNRAYTLRTALACAVSALWACADPASPPVTVHANRLLIPGTEDAVGLLVNVDAMSVVSHIGQPFVTPGPAVVADGRLLLALGMPSRTAWVLQAFDILTGRSQWEVPLVSSGTPVAHDGVELGTGAMALDAARHRLYFWPSRRDGVQGIAAFDYDRRQVADFAPMPDLQDGGVAFIPAYADLPHGSVAAYGAVVSDGRRHAIVYFLDGDPLTVWDSISVPTPVNGTGFVPSSTRRVVALQPDLDGREILVATPYDIIRFDVTTLAQETSITRSNEAGLVISPADGRVFIADPGSDALATTGLIFVYDRLLELSEIIDLHSLPPSERPLGILGGTVSADGRWLYLVTGVARNGPLYGPDFTRLYVVNVTTGEASILPLATLGGTNPILVP